MDINEITDTHEIREMEKIYEMHFKRAQGAVEQGGNDILSRVVQLELLSASVARMTMELSKRLDCIIHLLQIKK